MNNEEEKKISVWPIFIFWCICFYMRFFFDAPESAHMPLNYILVVLGLALPIGFYKEFMGNGSTEEKVILITPDHAKIEQARIIEQERVLKVEEARFKAKEDEKKAERAKLARLLDEL